MPTTNDKRLPFRATNGKILDILRQIGYSFYCSSREAGPIDSILPKRAPLLSDIHPDLVTVEDIAQEMQVSCRTVYRRVAANPADLPLSVVLDGRRYFVASDIARWRAQRVTNAVKAAKRARRATKAAP